MAMTRPLLAVTSWMLVRVFSYLRTERGVVGVLRGDADYGEGSVDEGVGAMLHLAGGVAFGVDVGDFFELEGSFEGDGDKVVLSRVHRYPQILSVVPTKVSTFGQLVAFCEQTHKCKLLIINDF
jgi:hypothetical protein